MKIQKAKQERGGFSRESKHNLYCKSCGIKYEQIGVNYLLDKPTTCGNCSSRDTFVTIETTIRCECGNWETTREHIDQITFK